MRKRMRARIHHGPIPVQPIWIPVYRLQSTGHAAVRHQPGQVYRSCEEKTSRKEGRQKISREGEKLSQRKTKKEENQLLFHISTGIRSPSTFSSAKISSPVFVDTDFVFSICFCHLKFQQTSICIHFSLSKSRIWMMEIETRVCAETWVFF